MRLKKVGVQWDGIHQLLLHDEIIEEHLPETWLFNRESFHWMWGRYPELVLKPTGERDGAGQIKLRRVDQHRAEIQVDMKGFRIPTGELFPRLQRMTKKAKTPYLLQQAVPRADLLGQPFEVRVLVYRVEPKRAEWRVLGMLAKVMGEGEGVDPKKFKGDCRSLTEALRDSNVNHLDLKRTTETFATLSIRSAERLGQTFPRHRMLGFDFAIDPSGWVWLLEAYPKPSLPSFMEQLRKKDYSQYREVEKMVRKHG
jgi:hypothetical protein